MVHGHTPHYELVNASKSFHTNSSSTNSFSLTAIGNRRGLGCSTTQQLAIGRVWSKSFRD